MKEFLMDVVRQAAPLFEKIRIDASADGTKVEAYTDDKMLFLFAQLKDVVPEFVGEFGIGNLPLLRGLLEFPNYKAENAQLTAKRATREGAEYVAELEFRDPAGGDMHFRTMTPRSIGERARIATVNWEVSVTPSKAKLTEVIQLTSMLSQVDQHFSVSFDDGTLFLTIGSKAASSHCATVALANDIEVAPLPTKTVFKATHFLSVLKNAGKQPCTIRFAKQGVAGIVVTTEHGDYNYVLRGTEV